LAGLGGYFERDSFPGRVTIQFARSQTGSDGPRAGRWITRNVSTIVFAVVVLGSLGGLYVWAGARARKIRRQAAEREQAALALMLSGGLSPEETAAEGASARKPIGRLLVDDPSEQAAALARAVADAHREAHAGGDLPPLEYQERNGARRALTPAEQAAADLDPIEDLISQIMVDEPPARQRQQPVAVVPSAPRGAEINPRRGPIAPNIPLRELALAWYEARGYRGSPASPAVWPIELVLRHREDAARAYAFVVQTDLVSVDRITALIEQAREIGMMRVAVIAENGYERGAKEVARKRNVRLIDRRTMEAELAELQLPTAAKIIAVARTRSSAEPSPA
jgi:hypothetical protein